jgi:Peptidyl-prolyl cis-trans isomerase (rotamase) - cyclophilin family
VISALYKGLPVVLVGALLAGLSSPIATAIESIQTTVAATNHVVAVQIQTELGPITLELQASQAPATVANFLRYVDAGKYDGATLYRTVRLDNQAASDTPIQVIQGGLHGGAFSFDASDAPETFPPIAHETTRQTGLKHVDGVISMARAAPGSATSEFFICIGDNPALDFGGMRTPDGQGFAAFGQVTAGMDIVRQIHARASDTPLPDTLQAVKGQILERPVAILSVRRIENASTNNPDKLD